MVKMWKEEQEATCFLRLFQTEDGVELRIVNAKGQPAAFGIIATIEDEGVLCLHCDIQNTLARGAGIQLDENNKIKVQEW